MTDEIKQMLANRNRTNHFANECGIEFRQAEDDRAVMALKVEAKHLNPLGHIHGGVYFTLADCASGMASCTDGRKYVTQCSSFNFLRGGVEGDELVAEAKVRKRGRSTCYVETELTIKGKLVATGSFQFFCVGGME